MLTLAMRRIEARYGGGRTVRAWRARGAVYASLVSGPRHGGDDLAGERARRRVARETMAAYHEEQLLLLLVVGSGWGSPIGRRRDRCV